MIEEQVAIGAPQPHAIAVLLLTLIALVLFTRERIPLQTSSLFVLCALLVGFYLFPYRLPDGSVLQVKEFFLGFGNEALIAVSALMIVGQALVRTGAMEPIDFARPVAIAAFFAILYLWLIVPKILPEREPPLQDTSPRVFTAQLEILPGGFADGKTLAEIRDKTGGEINVERIIRGDNLSITTLPDVEIKAGDRLVVSDTADRLRDYEVELGGKLYAGEHPTQGENPEEPFKAGDQSIAEVVVIGGSTLDRVRVGDARLNSKYGLRLLAIHSHGKETQARSKGVNDMVLRAGDVLLVQGDKQAMREVKNAGTLLVLDGGEELPHTRKAPLALLVMALVVATAAIGLMPIAVSAVVGVFIFW